MSLCPENEERQKLSDAEFWAHVFQVADVSDEDFEYYTDTTTDTTLPHCQVCGSTTACSYDSEGRPMIHVVEDEDD